MVLRGIALIKEEEKNLHSLMMTMRNAHPSLFLNKLPSLRLQQFKLSPLVPEIMMHGYDADLF